MYVDLTLIFYALDSFFILAMHTLVKQDIGGIIIPRKNVNLTARNRIMILLTQKTLPDSAAVIAKEIGFKQEPVLRDLQSLKQDGMVEAMEGKLKLTKKGKDEPLTFLYRGIRRIGLMALVMSFFGMALRLTAQVLFETGIPQPVYSEIILLYGAIGMIGVIVYFFPTLTLEVVKKG